VQIRNLHMEYADTVAVDDLSLDVARGSVTSILGPNGAGKTTTIETCEGFRKPHGGTVRVLGLDPIKDAEALHPRVGVMLQTGGAWLGVRAEEMLRHIASLHAHPLNVEQLMDRLGMRSFATTTYRRLSGGQKQRLSLAMAIVGRPELVFLDEPSAGLDPQSRHAVWKLVEELRNAGVTVVLTTHFMDEAEALSDFVYVVDSGRVIASGTPAEITAEGARNTMRFSTRSALDLADLSSLLQTNVEQTTPGTYLVHAAMSPAVVASLATWCAEHDILIDTLAVERQTLEDRFLDLTGAELR
jgi:ABC-2 type transport system ATP-binding protein